MSGVSKGLAADGLVVAAHQEALSPMLLFSDGICHDDFELQEALLHRAVRSAAEPSTVSTVSLAEKHPAGIIFTATLRLRNLVVTLTGLFRNQRSAQAAACRERLAALVPIVRPFFTMWSHRNEVARKVSGLEAALDTSGNGTLLLDRAGRLLFANKSGQEFLGAGRGLSADHGRLIASSLTETLRLNAAIEHLCSPGRSDTATTPVLTLQRRHMRPLMITLAAADAEQGEDGEMVVIARVFDPEHDPSELIGPACRFYGLSPSETRLTRYIAKGYCLSAAAAEMGVREQTARSYLKQVFLKTETNRQAELVAVMLRSAVRLAPHCRTQVF